MILFKSLAALGLRPKVDLKEESVLQKSNLLIKGKGFILQKCKIVLRCL
ncbi:MAG: hypothetical protein PWR24_1871 [Desulfonauticus sp.]|nr:hypothetical protein [Desulfonauticus sp.]